MENEQKSLWFCKHHFVEKNKFERNSSTCLTKRKMQVFFPANPSLANSGDLSYSSKKLQSFSKVQN